MANPTATCETSLGTFTVELYTDDGAVPGNDYDIYVDLVY